MEPVEGDVEPAAAAVAGPACKEADRASALATFDGPACPWIVQPDDGGVVQLQSLEAVDGPAWSGPRPDACADGRCSFRGFDTPRGPLLVVELRSTQSEMPAGVWLGLPSGDRLVFEDLWDGAGDSVSDGGVELGPTHGLAPFDCGGRLALLARARTVAGRTVSPASALLEREGPRDGADATWSREGCIPLSVPLP